MAANPGPETIPGTHRYRRGEHHPPAYGPGRSPPSGIGGMGHPSGVGDGGRAPHRWAASLSPRTTPGLAPPGRDVHPSTLGRIPRLTDPDPPYGGGGRRTGASVYYGPGLRQGTKLPTIRADRRPSVALPRLEASELARRPLHRSAIEARLRWPASVPPRASTIRATC